MKNYLNGIVVISVASEDRRLMIYDKLLKMGYPRERIKILSSLHTLEDVNIRI